MAHAKLRFALLALAGALMLAGATRAQEYQADGLTVGRPWSRASAGPARNGVGYLTVTNEGAAADRLVAVASDIAERAGLHEVVVEGYETRMRAVEAIDVPAGATVTLAPGGLHVMFFGLARPLAEGETFAAALSFERAGEVAVEFRVLGPGAMSPD